MKHFCKRPGCPNLVETGISFCTDHERKAVPVEQHTKVADPFYLSVAWRRLREWHISGQPLCVVCGAPGQIVHHILERKDAGGGDVEYAASNLETMCRKCHSDRHPRKKRTGKRQPKVYSYEGLRNDNITRQGTV